MIEGEVISKERPWPEVQRMVPSISKASGIYVDDGMQRDTGEMMSVSRGRRGKGVREYGQSAVGSARTVPITQQY